MITNRCIVSQILNIHMFRCTLKFLSIRNLLSFFNYRNFTCRHLIFKNLKPFQARFSVPMLSQCVLLSSLTILLCRSVSVIPWLVTILSLTRVLKVLLPFTNSCYETQHSLIICLLFRVLSGAILFLLSNDPRIRPCNMVE